MHPHFFTTKLAAACLIGCAACTTFAINAHAGPSDKGPAIEEWAKSAHDWSGFYMGANLGGALTDFRFRGLEEDGGFFEDVNVSQQFDELRGPSMRPDGAIASDNFATFLVPRHSHNDGAVIGGGQAGYQHQFGHFVVGVEGSFDRTSTSDTKTDRDFTSTEVDSPRQIVFFGTEGDTSLTARRRVEMNWMGAATAKVGYAQGPFLFYGIGGAAWTDVTVWANDSASTDFFDLVFIGEIPVAADFLGNVTSNNLSRHREVRTGWTAGGGIQIAFTRVVSLGLEYRHSGFGNDNNSFSSHGGPIFPGSTRVDIDTDQVTVKFDVNLSHFFGE
jgi:outer membrane immunogenic protein